MNLVIAGFLIAVGGVGLIVFCGVWCRVRSRRGRLLRRLVNEKARARGAKTIPLAAARPPS